MKRAAVQELRAVPYLLRTEDAGGGRIRCWAVREMAADLCAREVWVFLVDGGRVLVERIECEGRWSTRRPWEVRYECAHPLDDRDRRELAMLAGQAWALRVRSVGWRDDLQAVAGVQ